MGIVKTYPKLLFLCTCTLAAYILFREGAFDWIAHIDGTTGKYLAAFLGGLLFTFGFTAPFGIGVFIEVAPDIHPVPGAIVGATGAMLADMMIFEIMKFEFFHEELMRLRTTRLFLKIHRFLHHPNFSEKVRQYLLWCCAGMIISSPLPDEFGVAMVSTIVDINTRKFAMLSLICNAIGIFLILAGARALAN